MNALVLQENRVDRLCALVVGGKIDDGGSSERKDHYFREIHGSVKVRHDTHSRRIHIDQQVIVSRQLSFENIFEVIYVKWTRVFPEINLLDFSLPVRQDSERGYWTG